MAENKPLKIVVDDGYQRVPIENEMGDEIGVFKFNPTDIGIVKRYNEFASSFDSIVEPLGDVSGDTDELTPAQLEALKTAENRLYEAVNKLFNGDMASAFFGKVSPFTLVNGAFYCERALDAVRQFISDQFDVETKKISKRVNKYTDAVKDKK